MVALINPRKLWSISLLISVCLCFSGCLEFKSIDQPSSVLLGDNFSVLIEVAFSPHEDRPTWGSTPYFGICLPDGWTIQDGIIPYRGDYNGTIIYDSNLALEQDNISPAPDGYYWWIGDGNRVDPGSGTVYGEIQIKTNNHAGIFSLDYRLGNDLLGLNYQRSDHHLIDVVDEYTPREFRAQVSKDSIILTWTAPAKTEELIEYKLYRDGQWFGTVPAENTQYVEKNIAGGIYFYSVSAIYNDGQEHLIPYEFKGLMFSEGVGEPNKPYKIVTSEQLISIGDFSELSDKHFVLSNNINLDPNQFGGQVFEKAVIPTFSGTFDGNNHILSNLMIKGKSQLLPLGMFGVLEVGATVTNLTIADVNITGYGDYFGGLVGKNYGNLASCYVTGSIVGIEIEDCVGGLVGHNSGNITASYSNCMISTPYSGCRLNGDGYEPLPGGSGGLVGNNNNGTITTSQSTSIVSGSEYIGGLVGKNVGIIIKCYSTSTASGSCIIGGLVGSNNGGTISKSYSTATVIGDGPDIGGLVGENKHSNITSSYSTGSVSGSWFVGGLVGTNYNSSIHYSYSTSTVNGISDLGGLVGYNYNGDIAASFWNIETSGQFTSSAGIGKTAAEMQTSVTFLEAGWDFVDETDNGTEDVWWIDEGNDYPRLWWEIGDESSP
jgi:hypothetical protein